MKTLLLIFSLTCGILLPYGHEYAYLIRYTIMIMLFLAFLDLKIDRSIIHKNHFTILLLTIIISLITFALVKNIYPQAAAATFITSFAPTAIAAPVVTSLLRGRVEFVIFSLLLTNIIIAALLPFLIPALLGSELNITVSEILFPVISVIGIPLIAALLISKYFPRLTEKLIPYQSYSFYILVFNIYLGTSKATHFIKTELNSTILVVFVIALISLILCIGNFSLGRFIGRKRLKQETGQALGQKNNGFTMWVALTFINPLAALGPVFYILFQNLFISWQFHKDRKR